MSKAHNPYWQIARTYFRRKMMWLCGGVFLFMIIGLVGQNLHYRQRPRYAAVPDLAISPLPGSHDTTAPAVTVSMDPKLRALLAQNDELQAMARAAAEFADIQIFFFPQFFILMCLLAHLKEQIASPRAVHVPNYRRPHLVVAAVMALPVLIVIPLGISASYGLPLLGMLAIATVFSALVLWLAYLQRWPLSLIVVSLWLGAFSSPGRHALNAALANGAAAQNVLILAGGLAALAGLACRLMKLREEMPEYARQYWQTTAMAQGAQPAGPPINYNNPVNRFISSPAYRQLARLAGGQPASRWARLQRWQLAGVAPHVAWIFVPVVPVLICLMAFVGKVDVESPMFLLVFFPAMLFPQYAMVAWRTLGIESLRPISRAGYLRERAGALALQIAQSWLSLAATIVICAAVFKPEALGSPRLWLALGATALMQLPLFAVSVWILRFRWPLLAMVVPIAAMGGISLAVVGLCSAPRVTLPVVWIVAIVVAVLVVSGLVLRDAYRRWLRTDLA